ncbi:hypothetical protein ACFL4D_00275 [Candidatus Margulisiibacteriota bacterium]
MMNKNLEILDCTIRDGGYINNWDFDIKLVRETYRALSKAGVDYVELGYHGTEKYFDKDKYGLFRFTPVETVNEVCQGISGAKVAVMLDFGKYDLEDIETYKNSPVELLRIAFHKNKVEEALKSAVEIRKMGFKVAVNLMGFATYTEEEKAKLLDLLNETSLDYAYVADSYGSMFPNQLETFYKPLLKVDDLKWGFHPHNNLQMAFANTLAAIEAGAVIVDSSTYGMGRGAGNLPTEILLSYLQLTKPEKYNAIPVLNLIDRYYEDLHHKFGWGYDLPYMVSGIYGCHPSYAKDLVERKEYDIEEIWKVLEGVTSQNPVGFSKKLTEDILHQGFFRKKNQVPGEKPADLSKNGHVEVPYANRHQGRDFLILAGGPSFKKYQAQIESFIKKYDPIVLGANYLAELIVPDYHAFSNNRRFMDYVESVNEKSKLLLGQYIHKDMISEYTKLSYETMYYEDSADAPFDIKNNVISANCRTVSLLLMGTAIIMGAKRIFVAGLDGYTGTEEDGKIHFYNEKDETENRDVLMDKHFGNLKYLEQIDQYMSEQGNEGVHILTPTSYTAFYKGIKNYI